jgi:hypothetical protein
MVSFFDPPLISVELASRVADARDFSAFTSQKR